ncbi:MULTISPECIES: hypothetical protein [Aequorivita]|uniref:Lipoprotein n=1 Tax=Aequorivita iocasae TaxID=2803865 RepID=A0ABX7DS67_9FLAO|nr:MULTISPECIES: hypothetical protein [Aequorivita]QQX76388.1 hypothetical protein JK629_13825 [Aequorivita iocasae]UCA55857.1 hypothetical protein LDL78_13895 [Aequorivita sp. F7]
MMKNYVLFFMVLLLVGCSKSDDTSEDQLGPGPWDENIAGGNLKISLEPIISHQQVGSNEADIAYICRDEIPRKPLTIFQFKVYVPTYLETGYSSGIENFTVDVFYDNTTSESLDINLDYENQVFDELTQLQYSVYAVYVFNRNVKIYRENLEQIKAAFDVVYKDDEGEELYRGSKEIVYNISTNEEACSPTGGTGQGAIMFFKSEEYGCNIGLRVYMTGPSGNGEGTIREMYDFYNNAPYTNCGTNDPGLLVFDSLIPGSYTFWATCDGVEIFPQQTIEIYNDNCQAFEFKSP